MNSIFDGGPRPDSLVDVQDRLSEMADLSALLADMALMKPTLEGRAVSGIHHVADKIRSECVALRGDLERMRNDGNALSIWLDREHLSRYTPW